MVPEIQDLILHKASAQAIRDAADRLGMATLGADGRSKAARGLTTLEEVTRVTTL
jgi:type II secretory ATPase GspE/PulE/Tfp pilus assembly ATPase PilB-like protein